MDDSSASRCLRILIVEDHPVVRDGIAGLIESEPDLEVCGEAECANEALDLIDRTCPDLALIDITLNESSGIDLIEQIRSRGNSMKLLVVSAHDESLYGDRASRAGANGFIGKCKAMTDLIDAIRSVLRGETYFRFTNDNRRSMFEK